MSKQPFTTLAGAEAADCQDGEWIQITANPFLHMCCDCGLAHRVDFMLVNDDGIPVPMPQGASLALRFVREEAETARLRGQREDDMFFLRRAKRVLADQAEKDAGRGNLAGLSSAEGIRYALRMIDLAEKETERLRKARG